MTLFLQSSLPFSPLFACEQPVESFCADYFQGTDLQGRAQVTRTEANINYDWGENSPVRRISRDNFSVRWRGRFRFEQGDYEFRVSADDGVRVKLDGRTIIDHWTDAAGQQHRDRVAPGAGMHLVEVEYYDASGIARIDVDWKRAVSESAGGNRPSGRSVDADKPPIGVNLSSFNYWSSSVPFKDLLKQSGWVGTFEKGTRDACRSDVAYDEQGYPLNVPEGCVFRIWAAFHIADDDFWPDGTLPYRSGRYVLTYQGRATIKLSWDAKNAANKGNGRIEFEVPEPKLGIQVEVTEVDPAAPLNDMHIVHVSDEATFEQQPFNEKWLKLMEPFGAIRFKDWGMIDRKLPVYSGKVLKQSASVLTLPESAADEISSVNDRMVAVVHVDERWPRVFVERFDKETGKLYLQTPVEVSKSGSRPSVAVYDYANQKWPDRAQPGTFGSTSYRGIPFETMIQLANTLDVDPWIAVPTAADDDFVRHLAMLLKSRLKPDLKCYIEYSNETWNFIYPGYDYSEAKARQLQLRGTAIAADAWHAYRAVEIFKIFNDVFGEADLRSSRTQSRLVRVLTSQTAWLERAKSVMDWKAPGAAWPTLGHAAHEFADAWAATTYFYLDKNEDLENADGDELIDLQIENINRLFGTAEAPGIIRRILAETKARGLQLVAYEGGTHVLAPPNDRDLVAKLAALNNAPRMYEVYTRLLNQWRRLYLEHGADAVGVWNHLNDVSRYGKHGYWGLLQSTYQAPDSAPKYKAIRDWSLR